MLVKIGGAYLGVLTFYGSILRIFSNRGVPNSDPYGECIGSIHILVPAVKHPGTDVGSLKNSRTLHKTVNSDLFCAWHTDHAASVRPCFILRGDRVYPVGYAFVNFPAVSRSEVLLEDEGCGLAY